jgi:hypothetical protein
MSESKRMLTLARYSARFCGFITAPTSSISSHAAVMRSSLTTKAARVPASGNTSLWLNGEQVIVIELQVGQHRLLLTDQNTVLPPKNAEMINNNRASINSDMHKVVLGVPLHLESRARSPLGYWLHLA